MLKFEKHYFRALEELKKITAATFYVIDKKITETSN